MEFELGLKITRDADEQNTTDFHIAKDRAGPIFVSTETDSMFTLSAQLKGYEEENIKININEDGTRITISGEKMVSETIMSRWRVYKKEEEVKEFKKTFKIPDGVVLDRIRAKFGAENSSLTIYMPKSEKGIRGHRVKEVEEEEKAGETTTTRSEDTTEQKMQEKEKILKPAEKKHGDEQVGKADKDELPPLKKPKIQPQQTEEMKRVQEMQEVKGQAQEGKPDADVEDLASKKKLTPGDQGSVHEHENGKAAKHQIERVQNSTQKGNEGAVVEKKPGFFAPSFFMGSALIASLVMLVVGLVRTTSTKKRQ